MPPSQQKIKLGPLDGLEALASNYAGFYVDLEALASNYAGSYVDLEALASNYAGPF